MYQPIPGGNSIVIQDINCHLPPVGMVVNRFTGKLERVPILKRSAKKDEQYWERVPMPTNWQKKEAEERKRQKDDPDYFDHELEKYRQQEWLRRLSGCWVMIEGEPTYLTGEHYFYLQWFTIDTGYPDYRDCDREFFYVWQVVTEDPRAIGLVEITGRRSGKTYRAGSVLLNYISRAKNTYGGIQSKTDEDAAKVFAKAVVNPYKKLPSFFRPVYDQSTGITPKKSLRFYRTVKKGKQSEEEIGMPELESEIDFKPSSERSYDGYKLHRYIADECGKSEKIDVWERHLVVRYCFESSGQNIGKAIYTTTVEEMESGGKQFKRLWEASNQKERNDNGQTISGLYRFFTPVYKNFRFNKFGKPLEEEAKTYFLNERKSLQGDPRSLSSVIRKKPFTPEEAFRIDGDKCLYDSMRLNDQLDILSLIKNPTTRGNFQWKNGERDTEVEFVPCENGRWEVAWLFEDEAQANNVIKRESRFSPGNNRMKFAIGVDPFDHSQTVDDRRSDGAFAVYKKHNSAEADHEFNQAFVVTYRHRPEKPQIFYEDCLKTCFYFGAPMLYEDQKIGIKFYFEQRGYQDFLQWLPGAIKPGISSGPNVKQEMAEVTEAYIVDHCHKVRFKGLLTDWLHFKIAETEKFDLGMAAGYALIADKMIQYKSRISEDLIDAGKLFGLRKIRA
jgi:hypothetical protein